MGSPYLQYRTAGTELATNSLMPEKRIVFEHRQGPHAGLVQIMGLVSELGVSEGEPMPATAEGFEALERVVEFASLVEVKRSYVLYRETL